MNEEKYGDRADVYSFGLLLWQLITGKVSPFNLMFVFTIYLHDSFHLLWCIYLVT